MRASRSASIMGKEYGGDDRMLDTVDLPVAIEPVKPMRSILNVEYASRGAVAARRALDALMRKEWELFSSDQSHSRMRPGGCDVGEAGNGGVNVG